MNNCHPECFGCIILQEYTFHYMYTRYINYISMIVDCKNCTIIIYSKFCASHMNSTLCGVWESGEIPGESPKLC